MQQWHTSMLILPKFKLETLMLLTQGLCQLPMHNYVSISSDWRSEVGIERHIQSIVQKIFFFNTSSTEVSCKLRTYENLGYERVHGHNYSYCECTCMYLHDFHTQSDEQLSLHWPKFFVIILANIVVQ